MVHEYGNIDKMIYHKVTYAGSHIFCKAALKTICTIYPSIHLSIYQSYFI